MVVKTNKSILSRVKVCKKSKKLIYSSRGLGHCNAKTSNRKKLNRKRNKELKLSKKIKNHLCI